MAMRATSADGQLKFKSLWASLIKNNMQKPTGPRRRFQVDCRFITWRSVFYCDLPNCVKLCSGVNQQKTKKEKSDGYPSNMIGWSVLKRIGRHREHGLLGVVASYDSKTKKFQVRYQNGKSETVPCSEIQSLKPIPPEEALPMGSRPLMMRASNYVYHQPRPRGRGKKRARAQNAPAKQSGSSSAARGAATADSSNDGVNKRTKVQNADGSTAARLARKHQVQHSPRNN